MYYFIISGLILGIWFSYREYETNNEVSIFDILFNLFGGMFIGWLMLPIIALVSLDHIKFKK